MKKRNPVRSKVVQIRLCEHEHRRLQAAASAAGVTASTYVRGLLLAETEREIRSGVGVLKAAAAADRPLLARFIAEVQGQVPPPRHPAPKVDPELIRLVAIQGNLLNQVAKFCNEARLTGGTIQGERISNALSSIHQELHRLAGIGKV